MSAKNCAAPEIWREVRDWLVVHGVDPPLHPLPESEALTTQHEV